jgi:hypothetical protein
MPGVAGERAQQLRGAQPAGRDQVVGGPEADVEAAVEAHLQGHAGRLGGRDGPVGVGKGEGHGLLAEYRLAGPGGRHDQVGVEAGRGSDQDRLHRRVGQQLGRVGGGLRRAERAGEPLGRAGGGVGHADQPGPGQPTGQGLGVEGADGAGSDEPDRHRRGGGIADGHCPAPLGSEVSDLVKASRNRVRACSLSPEAQASSPTVPR